MAKQQKVCCPDCDRPTTFTFEGHPSEKGVRSFSTKERVLTLAYDVVAMNKKFIREFSKPEDDNSKNAVCDSEDRHGCGTLCWVYTPGLGMSKPMCPAHATIFRNMIDPEDAKDTVTIKVKLSTALISKCRAAMMLREPGTLKEILPVTLTSKEIVIF